MRADCLGKSPPLKYIHCGSGGEADLRQGPDCGHRLLSGRRRRCAACAQAGDGGSAIGGPLANLEADFSENAAAAAAATERAVEHNVDIADLSVPLEELMAKKARAALAHLWEVVPQVHGAGERALSPISRIASRKSALASGATARMGSRSLLASTTLSSSVVPFGLKLRGRSVRVFPRDGFPH